MKSHVPGAKRAHPDDSREIACCGATASTIASITLAHSVRRASSHSSTGRRTRWNTSNISAELIPRVVMAFSSSSKQPCMLQYTCACSRVRT